MLLTFQLVFDVTLNVPVLLAAAPTLTDVGVTDRVGVVPPAACVTVTVFEETPVADTVTVAERVVVPVFCCAVTVTVALFDPDAGLTASQVWLLETLQLVFEVTANVPVLFAAVATLTDVGETERLGLVLPHAWYQIA